MARIFLSNFGVTDDIALSRALESKQRQFSDELINANINFYDGANSTDYPTIFREIEASTTLVAFIDDYWMSSTWKMIELSFAAGASPENKGAFIETPLACYLYCPGIKNPNINAMLGRDNVHTFDGTWHHFMDLTAPNKTMHQTPKDANDL